MPRTKYPIFKCLHRGEKGFTLVELLIVIAILGILAAVVIPNVGRFMKTGRLNAANTEWSNVQTANMGYAAEHEGKFAISSTNLTDEGYLTGTLTGTYAINATTGWIDDDIAEADGGWTGLFFNATAQQWQVSP